MDKTEILQFTYLSDDGDKDGSIKVCKIPNYVYTQMSEIQKLERKYHALLSEAIAIQSCIDLEMTQLDDIKKLKDKQKMDEMTAKLQDYCKQAEKCGKEIQRLDMAGDLSLFHKKVELLIWILKKNNIEEKMYLEKSFWSENVEPEDIHAILQACVKKDTSDLRKKPQGQSLKRIA